MTCNLLCDYVGIEEFVKAIIAVDIDPIYYCELLKACAVNDNGDAKITSLVISPQQGPTGTTFTAKLNFVSKNGTGTGELYFSIVSLTQ